MTNVNERSSVLVDFMKDLNIDGVEDIIKNCLSLVHSVSPLEGPAVFSKMEKIISASDDLAYITLMINRRRVELKGSLNKLKDPLFTSLVRQNRPSTQAIECEIRLSNSEVKDLEERLSNFDDLIFYLNHIDRALSEYSRLLRDKLNF